MLVDSGTLASHHRRCSELFAAAWRSVDARNWGDLVLRINELREGLLGHFRYEEEHIFPLYEQVSGLEGSTEWLCAQHDDMRGALWMLGTISAERAPADYRTELGALQRLFDEHAADEESRMYPVFERMLGK